MQKYYDKENKPINLIEWMKLFDDIEYKRIDLTKFNRVEISTVWLGLNHNFGTGQPLIFETMVFKENDYKDIDMERYSTLVEAKKGHKKMVKKYKEFKGDK